MSAEWMQLLRPIANLFTPGENLMAAAGWESLTDQNADYWIMLAKMDAPFSTEKEQIEIAKEKYRKSQGGQ